MIRNLRYLNIVIGIALIAGVLPTKLSAKDTKSVGATKVVDELVAAGPTQSVININNIAYWITKSGSGTTSGSPNGTQADYPIGTGGLIYEDGMLWGARVNDGNPEIIRVGGSTYNKGLKAGRVVFNTAGEVIGSTDPADHHVWRVRTDFETVDLTADAANFLMEDEPSDADILDVYDQYSYDWDNWPGSWGAPYEELNGEDGYQPATWDATAKAWVDGDIPGYPGAAQTVWIVSNDVPKIVDSNGDSLGYSNTSINLYGADPIGIELQVTMWAYNFGAKEPLGNAVFKKATMAYYGLPGGDLEATLDTVYFTQWSDPDLGTYTDDYVGSDTSLSFGYVYNGNAEDGVFAGIYDLPVPAGGYDFLQGPITVDGDTLGMTSFTYFGAGSPVDDPDLSDYAGTLQFFNLMEGFLPRPEYPTQIPWTDWRTGENTKYALSGDPVTGQGWIDGVQIPPGDRRLVMASGPFVMKIGDSQDVVLALVGGTGLDNISSVTVAKFHDTFAQYAYDNDFELPSTPAPPMVQVEEFDGEILLDWGFDLEAVTATENPISLGFKFEGYNVYQIPSAGSPLSAGLKIETFDVINLTQTIFDNGVDVGSGFIVQQPKQSGSNSGIKRFFQTDYDALRNRPMVNGITYYFAISAYSYLEDNEGSPFKTLESAATVVAVTPHTENPGFAWGTNPLDNIETTHGVGTAGGSISASVANPDELTGDDYEVWFDKQHYYLNGEGNWTTTAYEDSVGKVTGKVQDVSPSSVSGVSYPTGPTSRDILFDVSVVSPDYNYAAGVKITFPAGTVINSATSGDGYAALISDDGLSVMFGDIVQDGAGDFAGGELVTVNIETLALPFDVDYVIYDDGWATLWCVDYAAYCASIEIGEGFTEIVNATGSATISEEVFYYKTIKHWNLDNTTTNETLLEDQFIVNGWTLEHVADGVYNAGGSEYGADANPITEGFQVNLNIFYAAPADFTTYTHVRTDGSTDVFSGSRATAWLNYDQTGKPYILTSYGIQGWAASSKASDTYGAGSVLVGDLQRDYEVRFTGVEGTPLTTTGGTYTPIASGGSLAMLWGARGYDIADHPDADNPGTGDPFLIRIPFEVWDMENPDGPTQAFIVIYDRIQNPETSEAMQSFDLDNRMYTEFSVQPYSEITTVDDVDETKLTWNIVWWNCAWTIGDVIEFNYDNPIQQGSDVWTFSTVANSTGGTIGQDDIDMISVYPNPYLGFHDIEENRSDKYVSFNHLPEKATIKVFTLDGTLVRQLEKDDTGQFLTWDLANQYGYPVASGMYIVLVKTDFGEKILKLALVQETQVLKYY